MELIFRRISVREGRLLGRQARLNSRVTKEPVLIVLQGRYQKADLPEPLTCHRTIPPNLSSRQSAATRDLLPIPTIHKLPPHILNHFGYYKAALNTGE